MQLYLLRHGEALAGVNDDQRPLTERGRSETFAVVEQAQELIGQLDKVYTSPKLRARQTADIAAQVLGDIPLAITDQLKPSASISELCQYLNDKHINSEHQNSQESHAILLVTHQPFVGELAAYLTGQPDLTARMGTSCLMALDVPVAAEGFATLKGFYCPQTNQ